MKELYSPQRIAELIQTIDPKFHLPSAEQAAIISITSNPLEPAVVIAGAGSGKTETMAARVVYLVANKFVEPHQILGLTFTRKAAGELNTRIRKRLRQFQLAQDKAQIPRNFTTLDTSVTTYHSYAGRLLSEHAIRFGIDADVQPMGEAALWMSAPNPCWAATSSEATSVAQATPSATRSAVRMCGVVSGTMTRKKISRSFAPSVRATLM